MLEVPLIAYTGDTLPGPHLVRDDVRKAQVVVSECTFFEPEHKGRAKIGMHLHVEDLVEPRDVGAEDRHVESHVGGAGEDHSDLVERPLDAHDAAAPADGPL